MKMVGEKILKTNYLTDMQRLIDGEIRCDGDWCGSVELNAKGFNSSCHNMPNFAFYELGWRGGHYLERCPITAMDALESIERSINREFKVPCVYNTNDSSNGLFPGRKDTSIMFGSYSENAMHDIIGSDGERGVFGARSAIDDLTQIGVHLNEKLSMENKKLLDRINLEDEGDPFSFHERLLVSSLKMGFHYRKRTEYSISRDFRLEVGLTVHRRPISKRHYRGHEEYREIMMNAHIEGLG